MSEPSVPLFPTNTAPSTGIPIVQGVLIGERAEIDAVPLIDVHTATILGHSTGFTIVQRPSLTEAMFAACERSNIYDIYDATGRHIFYAKERSEPFARICCAPRHSIFVDFKVSANLPPHAVFHVDIDTLPTAMTMERDGCPYKPCLGCFICHPSCKDGMFLHDEETDDEDG